MNKTGNLVVSLDFELFWGLVDTKTIETYGEDVLRGREAIPDLLSLFDKYDIHATWGTVGMLFANTKDELIKYLPDLKPDYDHLRRTAYEHLETIGANEQEDRLHYASSLIRKIKEYKNQEIASHTFCHYYCREKGQDYETFNADILAAKKIAKELFDVEIKSFIFPKNQFNEQYLQSLKENNVYAVRGNQKNFVYDGSSLLSRILRLVDSYIPICGNKSYRKEEYLQDGIIDIKASVFFRKYNNKLFFLEPIKMWNIKRLMKIAAKKGNVFHIWWHPHNMGENPQKFLQQLEDLFLYYKKLHEKYGFKSKNMVEIAEEVINEKNSDAMWKR